MKIDAFVLDGLYDEISGYSNAIAAYRILTFLYFLEIRAFQQRRYIVQYSTLTVAVVYADVHIINLLLFYFFIECYNEIFALAFSRYAEVSRSMRGRNIDIRAERRSCVCVLNLRWVIDAGANLIVFDHRAF